MIIIQSFGFKKSGIPQNSNMVVDVRFLRNPHDDPSLQKLDGHNPQVQEYIERDERLSTFLHNLVTSIDIASGQGKRDMVVSIGCTGGKHRSVYIAERLAHYLWYDHEVKHLEF